MIREKLFNYLSLPDWIALFSSLAVLLLALVIFLKMRGYMVKRATRALQSFSILNEAQVKIFKKFESKALTFYAFQPFQYFLESLNENDNILAASKKKKNYGGWVIVNYIKTVPGSNKENIFTAISLKVNHMRLPEISLRRSHGSRMLKGYLPINPLGLFPIYSKKLLDQSIPRERISREETRYLQEKSPRLLNLAQQFSRYQVRGDENQVIEWLEFMDQQFIQQLQNISLVGMEFRLNKVMFVFSLAFRPSTLKKHLNHVELLIQDLKRCFSKDLKDNRLQRTNLVRKQRESFFKIVYE